MANTPKMTSTTMIFVRSGSAASHTRNRSSCLSVHSFRRSINFFIGLSIQCLQVAVFQNREALDGKSVGIVVRTGGVQQAARRYEAALRHVALADNHLPRVGVHAVGIAVEIAHHRIDLQHLIDVARDDAVVVALLGEIRIVVIDALVGQQQGAFDVMLDSAFFGREREEQLVKAAHVLARFGWAVLREVLREGEHQRLATVEHVDLLSLSLGEAIGTPYRVHRNECAQRKEYHSEQTYLPKRRFDIFQ